MRHQKLGVIFDFICHHETASRDQLARAANISSASTSNFVNALRKAGLIRIQGERPSSGGRRAVIFEVNDPARNVIGVDLMGEYLQIALCDLSGKIVRILTENHRASFPLSFPQFLNVIKGCMADLSSEETERVVAIGIGIPGILDRKGECIVRSIRVPWINLPLREALERDLGRPVFLARSSHADLLAEKWFGVARGVKNCLFVITGMGIGLSMLLDGRLYTGTSTMEGEFGHVRIVPDGKQCGCGRRGCLETCASDWVIIEEYRKSCQDAEKQEISIEDLARKARGGDKRARAAFASACRYLGLGIADLIHLMNPEIVIIGGTMGAFADFCMPEIEQAIRENTLPAHFGFVRVEASSLGRDIGIKGAAALALNRLVHTPGGMEQLLRPIPRAHKRHPRSASGT